MRKTTIILLTAVALVLATVSCSTQKNTAKSRWWHSFNAKYNTYYNASQAFIEGNLEKEKGNKDNYTELIPLYPVGNKQSRDLGKSSYALTIEKCQKAIQRHSIKAKPEWKSSKPKTAKDREWLGRREYNPFIWKAWLLMGKAQFQMGSFDEAAATFSYMTRLYQTQPLMNGLARAWLAKCYTELGWKYDAEDVIRNMSRDSMDFRAVKDWDYTYANYYICEGDYQKAIPYLRKVIKHERRKVQKAREWFLLGQILTQEGHREEAYKAYGKVIGCHPPYELEFNARIAQTEVMAQGNGRQMISKLKRMAASDNNAEYLDQVYYAIGNIYLNQRDTTEAIKAYEQGNKKSVRNGIEKGVLLLTLGNLYWEKELFEDAQRCYGEAIGLLDKERPDYEELSHRSKVLDELVPHTSSIHLQDSLLELAGMPEAERNAAIDRVIEALKKKEKEERDALLESQAEQQQQNQQGFENDIRKPTTAPAAPTAGNGQWYFYNPTAVSQGKITFQQQWGKRENTDNWQRTNQTVVNLNGNNPDNQEEQGKSGNQDHQGNQDHLGNQDDQENQGGEDILAPNDSIAADPHQREYYLAQIPFTEEQQAASHQLIKDALFHAGIILKDKIDNLELSEAYLLRLTENYDDFEHLDEAWYHLFLLYSRQGDARQAENCLNRLKADYPESEWTILLSDPYYAENARFGEHIEDSLYAATYEAFKADRADIIKANAQLSESRFPSGANRDKFIFIDGLSHLNEGDGDGCMERLQVVVEKYPDSEVSPLAGMIIKGVQEGRKLHGGKFDIGDVWTRRDITLTRDSTVSDTLSADRNQEYLFMLIYEPDSVNENQLLFEMAKYNFTNFLVRNFEIQLDEDNGLHRMTISGFLSYDEALQYARQLYQNETLTERIKPCRNLIISKANLALIGRQFSYDDYQLFYEETLQPMPISKEKLLIIPEEMEQPDIEDIGKDQDTEEEEEKEDEFMPANKQQKQQVKDFDFGDDFW
jgi:tetratricopeptide (TPR) repeat protein